MYYDQFDHMIALNSNLNGAMFNKPTCDRAVQSAK